VENYFSILEDLLIGYRLPIFTKKSKEVFQRQIITYANGAKSFEAETETNTFQGKTKQLRININFKPLPVKNKKVIFFFTT